MIGNFKYLLYLLLYTFIYRFNTRINVLGLSKINLTYLVTVSVFNHISNVFVCLNVLELKHKQMKRAIMYGLIWYLYFITINLCWWTIGPRGYHPPSSQSFGTDMVY